MANRKRIALLLGQPEEENQNLFIQGFLKHAFECDFDVCIFAMYQKYHETASRTEGESNIYSLIEYDMFDAIVVLLDTIQAADVADNIEEQIYENFKGPVICVDKESRFFPTVMTDHYTPVKQLISHLIDDHGYKDIAYVTGKEWHPHSKQRLQGFLDCMAEHGEIVGVNRVFYGDFWYTSGANVAEQLLKNPEYMPEAVACANDCMAIGLAEELEKHGVKIPEDVAVIGYDASDEGKSSPQPITSAPIPASECGEHIVECVIAGLEGKEFPKFEAEVDLFIGSSCGCHHESLKPKVMLREKWETEKSSSSFYAPTNRMSEDMLMQDDLNGLVNTLFMYAYQIRNFESFHLCLNDYWNDADTPLGKTFSDTMIHALQLGKPGEGADRVDLNERFDRKLILPGLFEDRETPSAYIFTPLYFEDISFGYAAVSFGNEPRCYTETYRLWLYSAMYGLEFFRKTNALNLEIKKLKAEQVRDSKTGFYNYNGFIENTKNLIEQSVEKDCFIGLIAVEINGLSKINKQFGIQAGDQTIVDIAGMLKETIEDGIFCSLGNEEFLVAMLSENDADRYSDKIQKTMDEYMEKYNTELGTDDKLYVVIGNAAEKIKSTEELEDLINDAVSNRNGNKASLLRHNTGELSKEEKSEAEIVRGILRDNKFTYNFQPIVKADTGEIYAYEALMRTNVDPPISPLSVLKYAEYFNRLADVERATFFNVLDFIDKHEEAFIGKKVFINSIPGVKLVDEESLLVRKRLMEKSSMIVVELTEQAELDDIELSAMREEYEQIGIETALDDYGTGYSNVTNLLRYMPNYVKIDRMLLTGIEKSPQKQHFVKDIIEYSHDNGIMALAEGIETAEELKEVIRLGADLIQGFYTARPSNNPIPSINLRIQTEIIQNNQLVLASRDAKVYTAGQESKVSLVKLASQHYGRIQVMHKEVIHRDISIAGVPGFNSNMDIVIGDLYTGRIELENVTLAGDKNKPCITIGEKCDVTLVLNGDNVIESGGIYVPETSMLTIQGDGNLYIKKFGAGGYGIGSGKDEKHGDLIFEQDGIIEIEGDAKQCVGIGSGLGGNIQIINGKYVIKLSGHMGVGIGAVMGGFTGRVYMSDVELNIENNMNVGIGSLLGDTELRIKESFIKGVFGGTDSVGLGTVKGAHFAIDMEESSFKSDFSAENICGIGNLTGDADIQFGISSINIIAQGKNAMAIGNSLSNAVLNSYNTDITTDIKSNLDSDIGAKDMKFINGRLKCMLNGKMIEREILEGNL